MSLRSKIGKYRRVMVNFFSLSMINGVSYLLALVTMPYLIRVLGEERYGAYLFIYTVAQYLLLAGNYGFRFSVTRQISVHRDDKNRVNEIFNATIVARLIISLAVVLPVLAAVAIFMDSDDVLMYLFALGIVFGDILIPVWLFQGLEEMKYLTIVNVISKFVFAGLIFIFITNESDYVYVVLLNSMGYVAAGVASLWIAMKHFGIRFSMPTFAAVKAQYRDGWHIFVSNIGMELYRNSNIFLLRVFAGEAAVGIYGAVEKIVKAVQTILNALPMALFPYISRLFYGEKSGDNVTVLMRLVKWAFLLLSVVAVAFIISSKLLYIYLGLEIDYEIARTLVWLMAPVLLFGCMNYIVGIVGLLNLGAAKSFQRNIWVSAVISVSFMLIFCNEYSYYAAAAAWTIAEFLLFILCLFSLRSIKRRKEVTL